VVFVVVKKIRTLGNVLIFCFCFGGCGYRLDCDVM
jgi:hypothetical protein